MFAAADPRLRLAGTLPLRHLVEPRQLGLELMKSKANDHRRVRARGRLVDDRAQRFAVFVQLRAQIPATPLDLRGEVARARLPRQHHPCEEGRRRALRRPVGAGERIGQGAAAR